MLVYDYELMLLPAMLRKRFPGIACGFFFQCPFPSSEFYRILPVRQARASGGRTRRTARVGVERGA